MPLGKCYRLSCQIRTILHIIRRTYQKIVIYQYCYLYYYNIIIIGLELVFSASSVSPFNICCFTSKYECDTKYESLSSSERGEKLQAPSHSSFTFLIFMGRKRTHDHAHAVVRRKKGPWTLVGWCASMWVYCCRSRYFFEITVRRNKHCLEISKAREILKMYW